jgi:hypothetical protein
MEGSLALGIDKAVRGTDKISPKLAEESRGVEKSTGLVLPKRDLPGRAAAELN